MIRRVTDFTADEALLQPILDATRGAPVQYASWRSLAEEPTSRVYVDDVRHFIFHIVIARHPSIQIVFWGPLEVTDATAFRQRLGILAFGLNEIVAEDAARDGWRVWGFVPQTVADAFRTRFGQTGGVNDVISEVGTTPRNGLPLVGNVHRASGLVSRIRAKAGSLAL